MKKQIKKPLLFSALASLLILQAGTFQNTNGVETKDNFMINASKSLSERSGQIFAIPNKYNIVMGDYSLDGFSHFRKAGKIVKAKNLGTGHGSPWNYDTHIPIIMYGSGFINSNKKVSRFVTQQDLVMTYANILKTEPPVDAEGTVLSEAFKKTTKKPKAILTLILDQVGMEFFYKHQNSFPEIKKIMRNGTFFTNAKVTHLESETAVGHTAIGTGAYPENHGISSNSFWVKGLGKNNYSFSVDNETTPILLKSPTLADVYDLKTNNEAHIISYGYAERASVGMAGHGSMFNGGDKDMVFFYNDKEDNFATNEKYYSIPSYIKDMKVKPYLDKLTNGTGVWMEHKIPYLEKVKKFISKKEFVDNKAMLTSIFPVFEGDMFTKIINNEDIGQDDVTDLLYFTFKSTDLAAHAFGFESEEAKEVLESVDHQLARVIRAFEEKVGKDNIIVTITADHGSTPLVERTGGSRLIANNLKDELNKKFDTLQNGLDIVLDVGATEITLDEKELKRNHKTMNDIKKFLLDYKVKSNRYYTNFYKYVFTKDELVKFRYEREYKGK